MKCDTASLNSPYVLDKENLETSSMDFDLCDVQHSENLDVNDIQENLVEAEQEEKNPEEFVLGSAQISKK